MIINRLKNCTSCTLSYGRQFRFVGTNHTWTCPFTEHGIQCRSQDSIKIGRIMPLDQHGSAWMTPPNYHVLTWDAWVPCEWNNPDPHVYVHDHLRGHPHGSCSTVELGIIFLDKPRPNKGQRGGLDRPVHIAKPIKIFFIDHFIKRKYFYFLSSFFSE